MDGERDFKRIRAFCNRLAALWETFPDLRFGQLVSNVFCALENGGRDPFYLEEPEMIKAIEGFYYDHKEDSRVL